ncbi:MAG: CDGSH iron-sulfur domain-containing protein, partial [Candidatus Thiodiazotropha weberae]|nr:CDGSH iron-sulfur domain-containing protein [Candidatus Thiodiazotropha lotti]MCW4211689.1 CDGSH iron-sulfur domain-containing protein [Candidatus Thiodiazotropha lotti]
LSKNKPYCDNSHEGSFKDYGAVGETGEPLKQKGGQLKITPLEDGPLLLSGSVTVKAGSGRSAWQGEKLALCRCGASKNKPFCDGTHNAIGFKTE